MKPTIIIRRNAVQDTISFVNEKVSFDVHSMMKDNKLLKKIGNVHRIRDHVRELVVNAWCKTNGFAVIYPE